MASDRGDDFEDIIDGDYGMFSQGIAGVCGSGVGELESASVKQVPDGVIVKAKCGNCCAEIQVGFEYPNFIAIKYNVQPQIVFQGKVDTRGNPVIRNMTAWGYEDPHGWFPAIRCPKCSKNPQVFFTPEEAERYLRYARTRGWLPQQYEEALAHHAAATAKQLRSQAGR